MAVRKEVTWGFNGIFTCLHEKCQNCGYLLHNYYVKKMKRFGDGITVSIFFFFADCVRSKYENEAIE